MWIVLFLLLLRIGCYVLSVSFAGLTLMWFIKLSSPTQQATVQPCIYLPRPPPLPDPSSAPISLSVLLRFVVCLSWCPTASAAPMHFWKVCYITWVGGISSGLLLFLFVAIIVWLFPYLRLGCWVFSPVLTSFGISVHEVLHRTIVAVPIFRSIFLRQMGTMQAIVPRLVVANWSDRHYLSSWPFQILLHSTLLGLLSVSSNLSVFPRSTFVWLLLQVWLELPWLWQAAEDNCGYLSRPPPLPDPSRRTSKHQAKHWQDFKNWCNLFIAPFGFTFAATITHLPSRSALVQYLGLLLGCCIVWNFSCCLSSCIGKHLDRVSNKQIGVEMESYTNRRGRFRLRVKRPFQSPPVTTFLCQILFQWLRVMAVCITWSPCILLTVWWHEFLSHFCVSFDDVSRSQTLSGLLNHWSSIVCSRGLIVVWCTPHYLYSIPNRWRLFLQDITPQSSYFSDTVLASIDESLQAASHTPSWTDFPCFQEEFRSVESPVKVFDIETSLLSSSPLLLFEPVDVQLLMRYHFSWRFKRRLRNVSKMVDSKMQHFVQNSHITCSPGSSSANSSPSAVSKFLLRFNPAIAGLRLLFVEREKQKPRIINSKHTVSVDLKRCHSNIMTHLADSLVFPTIW